MVAEAEKVGGVLAYNGDHNLDGSLCASWGE